MAEWLGSALQKLLQRFESASDLTEISIQLCLDGDFSIDTEKYDVMKKLFLLTLPFLFVAIDACGSETASSETMLVKTISEGCYFTEFEYDDMRRLKKVTSLYRPQNSIDMRTYVYTDHSIVESSEYCEVTYTLDADGYVTNYIYSWNIPYEGKYIYADGNITKRVHVYPLGDDHYENFYTWENGNITKVTDQWESVEIEYSDVENKVNLFMPFEASYLSSHETGDPYIKFRGMSSKNLPLKEISEDGTIRYSYSYTFNAEGYPTSIITTDYGNNEGGETIISECLITYY